MLHRWNDWQVSALLLAHHFLFLFFIFFDISTKTPWLFFFFLKRSDFLFSFLSVGTDAAARSQGQCECATRPADSYTWPALVYACAYEAQQKHTQSQHKVAISLSRLFCCYCVIGLLSHLLRRCTHILWLNV